MKNEEYPDDLVKLPVLHKKDKDNKECVFFYSTGSIEWKFDSIQDNFIHTNNLYSDKTYFFLSSDVERSEIPKLKKTVDKNSEITFDFYDECKLYEKEEYNLSRSGRRWYSDKILQNSTKSISFDFPNAVENKMASIIIAAAAASNKSTYNIIVNNSQVETINFKPLRSSYDHAFYNKIKFDTWQDKKIDIKIKFEFTGDYGHSWLDYINLNVKSKLVNVNKQLYFMNKLAVNHDAVTFKIKSENNNLHLWDISNPIEPLIVNFSKISNVISFKDNGRDVPQYILFDVITNKIPEPELIASVENQNIHGLHNYDMIIVTHPNFIAASERLADFHIQDGLTVLVVSTEEVYNEFSSGLPDLVAIRNMARMFYARGKATNKPLKYLLLMGDGSYDNRNFNSKKSNFIPTYESEDSESGETFVTDDFFALLDEDKGVGEYDGFIDIGIGRIPCSSVEEAELVVDKTIAYTTTEAIGDWRNIIAFLADDEDNNLHMRQTEGLIDIINDKYPGFYTDKIYFDAFLQLTTSVGDFYPGANKALNRGVNEGALIVNYIGHANETSIGHENVVAIADIKSWTNKNKLPIFVTATCEFSRFDDDKMSAGEHVLFNPAGGGVALFSTTRLVYSSYNYTISQNFYKTIFEKDENGENLRMGDIMRIAKNLTTKGIINKRCFAFLGDPALRLAFPKNKIITKSINNQNSETIPSFGALDKVFIKSEVVDYEGNLLSDFNGTASTIVYDKEVKTQTLGNDNDNKFEFNTQSNIIYKGISIVKNGTFEVSFIVPKDIAYNVGQGKINYYTNNKIEDGNGSFDQFNIGGTSDNPVVDNTPPEIDLYMNNEDFKSYDIVSSSALLIAHLYDESGINTVGTGIGHDITAIIDDDYSKQFVLNDFYLSDINSYQSGKIIFPLNDLDPGKHKITIKAWDVQNQSSTKELYFIVEDGFKITSVYNTPNPVKFYTTFEIKHNLPGNVFDTTIEIFNLRGKKIHEINETTGSYGTIDASIRWDVLDTKYPLGQDNMLVYLVTMRNIDGFRATGAGKLILKHK